MKAIQYRFSCEQLIFNYLKDDNLSNLIVGLSNLENHAHRVIAESKYPNKELWFKFRDDTLVYSIKDIQRDLDKGNRVGNREKLIEHFNDAISLYPGGELIVFFS